MKAMKLYTAEEVATYLNVSKQTVWRYGRQGKLQRVQVGRTVRFALPEMETKNVK